MADEEEAGENSAGCSGAAVGYSRDEERDPDPAHVDAHRRAVVDRLVLVFTAQGGLGRGRSWGGRVAAPEGERRCHCDGVGVNELEPGSKVHDVVTVLCGIEGPHREA